MVTFVLFIFGLFAPVLECHTVAICSAVLSNQSTFIGAATYHSISDVYGGILLSVGGEQTHYSFTGWEDDSDGRPLLSCCD